MKQEMRQKTAITFIVLFYVTVILLAIFLPMSPVKANTLICHRINDTEIYLFRENYDKDDIYVVFADSESFSTVTYNDGRRLYLNSTDFTCHLVMSKTDEREEEMVKDVIDMITGDNLE